MNIPFTSKWVDIEIFELRAGGIIRIVDDKVKRNKDKDGSQYYYLKKANETLEPQEFEDIYVGTKGKQKLKVFSPTKGVYLPINFMFQKTRELTDEEQKNISEAETDEKKKEITRKIYADIYKAQFDTRIDTDTLNHFIYKIRKNKLRLQTGGGMSPQLILSMVIIFMAVAFFLMAWAEYSYIIKPGMDFWNEQAPLVLELARISCPQNVSDSVSKPVPVPVG